MTNISYWSRIILICSLMFAILLLLICKFIPLMYTFFNWYSMSLLDTGCCAFVAAQASTSNSDFLGLPFFLVFPAGRSEALVKISVLSLWTTQQRMNVHGAWVNQVSGRSNLCFIYANSHEVNYFWKSILAPSTFWMGVALRFSWAVQAEESEVMNGYLVLATYGKM